MMPDRAAAMLPGVGVFRAVGPFAGDVAMERHSPRVRGAPRSPPATLGRTRDAVPAPDSFAGRGVVRIEVAATSLLPAAHARDDAPPDGDRRAGHVVALLV